MSVYIYGIICASVAIGIAELLVPESAKTRPYIKLIFSLALLAVIVKPLGELAEMLPTLGERIFAVHGGLSPCVHIIDQIDAANRLDSALDIWVNAVTEAYPDLKANEQFTALQDELSGTENRICRTKIDSDIFDHFSFPFLLMIAGRPGGRPLRVYFLQIMSFGSIPNDSLKRPNIRQVGSPTTLK